jgi:hypothetical protein
LVDREESFAKLLKSFLFRYPFVPGQQGDKSTRSLAITWGAPGCGKSRFVDAVASLDKDLYHKMFNSKYFKDLSKNNLLLNEFKDVLLNQTVPIAITFYHHSPWNSS